MEVRGIGSAAGAFPVRPLQNTSLRGETASVSRPVSPQDEVQISSAGKMLDQISQNSEMRQERLARIKEAIANGTYDTDAKLEAALERMLGQIGYDLDDEA